MRRGLAFLLTLLMLAALVLTGCSGRETPETTPESMAEPTPEPTAEPTPEPTLEPTPEPTPEPDRSLSWARAFRDESLEGSLTPEEIAFYTLDAEENPVIVNVPRSEVLTWWNEQESLPRTSFYEQYMPEAVLSLLPTLDYAMGHSYSRFCVPTTEFSTTDVGVAQSFLLETYRINGNGISAEICANYDMGDGCTLRYILVTLRGMDSPEIPNEYQEAFAAAKKIVAGIPEGSGDYEKILFLYRWLTDNVVYDYNDYYGNKWNLLYDTMVKKQTVCAGYSEALYVMANLAGVECFTQDGAFYNGEDWVYHIWNVAKIDGEYYLFDSTWDGGVDPSRYCFFGISDETMQSFASRLILGTLKDYYPACTKDLPTPGSFMLPEDLAAGTVENGVYSQLFMDLKLSWDESWTVYSREEVVKEYYGGKELSLYQYMRMGESYIDLVLNRDESVVQVFLEIGPVELSNGNVCDTSALYMDAITKTLPIRFEAKGLSNVHTERYQTEIDGRVYECMTVSGSAEGATTAWAFFCTEREGYFLLIYIDSGSADQCAQILQELLAGNP